MQKPDGIIFDLDGTLWDSTPVICKIYNEVLKEHFPQYAKEVSLKEVQGYMGKTMYDIGHGIMPKADEKTCLYFMDLCSKAECKYLSVHNGNVFEGVVDTLTELSKDYKLFIVSNCQDGYIESFLAANQCEHLFTDFQWNTGNGITKGELNRMLVKRNQLKNAVYVGDILGDAISAKEANLDFIFASYGFGEVEESMCIAKLEDFRELPKVLTSLCNE
jgi:phosphoglycolate phosphatase